MSSISSSASARVTYLRTTTAYQPSPPTVAPTIHAYLPANQVIFRLTLPCYHPNRHNNDCRSSRNNSNYSNLFNQLNRFHSILRHTPLTCLYRTLTRQAPSHLPAHVPPPHRRPPRLAPPPPLWRSLRPPQRACRPRQRTR